MSTGPLKYVTGRIVAAAGVVAPTRGRELKSARNRMQISVRLWIQDNVVCKPVSNLKTVNISPMTEAGKRAGGAIHCIG